MSELPNHVIAQVVILNDDGLPRDEVTNSLHFHKPESMPYATFVAGLGPAVASLYNTIGTGMTSKVSSYMSNANQTGSSQATVNMYDGSVPVHERIPTPFTFTLGAPTSGTDLPNEVALCLSFKRQEPGVGSFASQRGRIYIGPLSLSAITNGTSGPVPTSAFITDLVHAGINMKTAVRAIGDGADHCVFSPRLNKLFVVTSYWVDNAMDTQRRRGPRATSRTTLVF